MSITSAKPVGFRFSVPLKITPSILSVRNDFALCSPTTQRMASEMLLLPQPFGCCVLVERQNRNSQACPLGPCCRPALAPGGCLLLGQENCIASCHCAAFLSSAHVSRWNHSHGALCPRREVHRLQRGMGGQALRAVRQPIRKPRIAPVGIERRRNSGHFCSR